jgi:hypothetical protein
MTLEDLAYGLRRFDVRQPDIDEHDVRTQLVGESNPNATSGGLCDYVDVGSLV